MWSKFNRWTPKSRERWRKASARGQRYFIFKYGVCGWGGSVFVCLTLLQEMSWLGFKSTNSTIKDIVFNFLFFVIGGYLWGYLMWRIMGFLQEQDARENEQ